MGRLGLLPIRKRPVNPTLNEDLVSQAKSLIDYLSGMMESLLAEFVTLEGRERLRKSKPVGFPLHLDVI